MADEEKQLGELRNPSASTLVPNMSANHEEPKHLERVEKDGKLIMDEDKALAYARANPHSTTPIYIVYSAEDKDNPRNWADAKRWYVAGFASWLNVLTCWCAGSISSGAVEIQDKFDVSREVTTLALSLYVLGFAVGPMLLAPFSEHFGRRPVYVISWFCLFVFQIPIAVAPNIGTILVCRFLGGFAGGAPLTNTGGTVSDLFRRNESGGPMAIYGLSSTFGPPSALVFSGYLAQIYGFKILYWTLFAITGGFWVLMVFTMPETRHSKILEMKTKRLRKVMEKEGLETAKYLNDINAEDKTGLVGLFKTTLTRPFYFLFTEPITIFAAVYNGFLYGLVYLFNESFPIVFGPEGHGFSVGEQGLAFLGLVVGSVVAFCCYPLQERYYLQRVRDNGGKGVPEARVWLARWGAILIPASLFWFAWTSYTSIHWIVPIIASAFFAAGLYLVILSILCYVVDAYQTYSASALAGVILVRNLVGGGFPLFARQMYETLDKQWASSLLAFIGILLVPIPFILFYQGEAIRYKSPWARKHFDQDEDMPH